METMKDDEIGTEDFSQNGSENLLSTAPHKLVNTSLAQNATDCVARQLNT